MTKSVKYKIIKGKLTFSDENGQIIDGAVEYGGSLDLSGTQITALPENLTVGGSLNLEGTQITALPDDLTVGGSLNLEGTQITALPDDLTVGGWLNLSGTQITALPDDLTVGGWLNLSGTQITAAEEKKVNRNTADLSFKIKIAIEAKFNLRGFSIADGILARILSSKNAVKKVIPVGKKKPLYLVTDGNGNFSHGETIREARADLVYKTIAKFDGELPEKAAVKEWIGIYRAVTGACSTGTKMFIEEKGLALEAVMTAKEVSKIVTGRYNAEKFKELVR